MLIDITRNLEKGIYIYPGDPEFCSKKICSTENGDICTVTEFSLGTHTGTHIDAPAHFIDGGRTIDTYTLDDLCGKALVIESPEYEITPEIIGSVEEGIILLFKTPCSAFEDIQPAGKNAYLSDDAAKYIISKKIRLIGIDCLSADNANNPSFPVHMSLLGAGIPILENIDLSKVSPGLYNLYCFPLKITRAEAAPVRAAIELI